MGCWVRAGKGGKGGKGWGKDMMGMREDWDVLMDINF